MLFLTRYEWHRQWWPIIKFYAILTIFVSIFYTFLGLVVGQIFFFHKANGSLIYCQKHICGSGLIGQSFSQDSYFWGRPSLTKYEHDWMTKQEIPWVGDVFWKNFSDEQSNKFLTKELPEELLYPSASQLDPQVSVKAIELQLQRVAQARSVSPEWLSIYVKKFIQKPFLGIFGLESVNVTRLNHALDLWKEKHAEKTT